MHLYVSMYLCIYKAYIHVNIHVEPLYKCIFINHPQLREEDYESSKLERAMASTSPEPFCSSLTYLKLLKATNHLVRKISIRVFACNCRRLTDVLKPSHGL